MPLGTWQCLAVNAIIKMPSLLCVVLQLMMFLLMDNAGLLLMVGATAGLVTDCILGLRQHFHCRCSVSNPRPVLDSSSLKATQGIFELFLKPQNELIWSFLMFLAIFGSKIDSFLMIAKKK